MPKGVLKTLRLSTTAMVFSGYFALMTTREYSPLILFFPTLFMLLMPWCERIDAASPGYRRFTWSITLLFAIAGMPLLPFVLGGPVPGLVGLFIFIEGYLLLHVKRSRDYHYLILMSFFFLVSGCHLDPDPSYGLVLSLFVISAVWTFLSLLIYSESLENAGRPWAEIVETDQPEDYVPSKAPRLFDRNLVTAMSALSVGAVMMTIGIFLLTPRMEAGGLGGGVQGPISRTGLSDTVDLSSGGRIIPNQSPVMQVSFPDEPAGKYQYADASGKSRPPDSTSELGLYWRVTTLNRFDGVRWERVPISEERYRDKPGRFYFFPGTDNTVDRSSLPHRRTVRQSIFLDDKNAEGLPGLPLVKSVHVKTGRVQWDSNGDFTVAPARQLQQSLGYEVISEVELFSADDLRAAPDNYADVLGYDYGTLTQHRLSEESVALALKVTAGKQTPYDKLKALETYLSGADFTYTLNVPNLGSVDPIDRFLLTARTGHCQLFATAMALMARSIGIPTRVVSGYRGGEWSDSDGAYIVRNSMAHLWVEAYFIGFGWVTFDPAPQSRDADLTWWESVSLWSSRQVLNAKMLWFRDVVGFEGGFRIGDLRLLAFRLMHRDFSFLAPSALAAPMLTTVIGRAVLWTAGLIAVVWILVYLSTLRRAPRAFRAELTPDQVRAVRLFVRLKRRLKSLGMDCRGKTAREILEFVLSEGGALNRDVLDAVLEEYNKVRFGGRPLTDTRFAELNRSIKTLKKPSPAQ